MGSFVGLHVTHGDLLEVKVTRFAVLPRPRPNTCALLDQPNRLKRELACKLPTLLHGLLPAPLNTLTRCLRNRAQAIVTLLGRPPAGDYETKPLL